MTADDNATLARQALENAYVERKTGFLACLRARLRARGSWPCRRIGAEAAAHRLHRQGGGCTHRQAARARDQQSLWRAFPGGPALRAGVEVDPAA